MIAFRLLSALGLLQLSTYSVHAGSVLSCDEQRGCFVYTIEKITSSTCDVTGDCLFTACINVNIGLDDCDKEDGISHICDQSGTDTCPLMPAPTWKKDEGANGVASSMECQTGQGGQQLFWAFKDGENGTPCTTSSNFPEEIPTGGSLTCGPTTAVRSRHTIILCPQRDVIRVSSLYFTCSTGFGDKKFLFSPFPKTIEHKPCSH